MAFGASPLATHRESVEGESKCSPSRFDLTHNRPRNSAHFPYRSAMTDQRPPLTRFAWLAVLAAVLTIGFKAGAYLLTGSVGLLSDALESLVNLVAAIAALIALTVAEKAPDEEHAFGHGKAEYFSSGLEGALVLVAAVAIVVDRAASPSASGPHRAGWVGPGGLHTGHAHQSGGGPAAPARREELPVDHVGSRCPASDDRCLDHRRRPRRHRGSCRHRVDAARSPHRLGGGRQHRVDWRGAQYDGRCSVSSIRLYPKQSARPWKRCWSGTSVRPGSRRMHCAPERRARADSCPSTFWSLGPGRCSRGHQLLEAIEHDIRAALPNTTVFTHLESLDDPASFADTTLDRSPLG